ncbi:uncharacterized protein PgNI_08732, partial [Pyricularia grisea]|uniref:Uncharacterized protein n=1 Tax=Pyricularia grisea TaxID=148305 RepID=A0A6P8AVX1_PYRGI
FSKKKKKNKHKIVWSSFYLTSASISKRDSTVSNQSRLIRLLVKLLAVQ